MDDKVDIHMPLFIGDYLADTMDLTTEEHGAYLLILMELWRRRGVTGFDHAKLARIARLPLARWKAAWGTLGRFFTVDGGELRQKRITKELDKAIGRRQAASESGQRGAAARWGRHSNPIGDPTGQPIATPLATPIANAWQNDGSLSSSSEESVGVAPAHARDPMWPAGEWLNLFRRAWADRYKTLTYGQTSDGKACGNLADFLGTLDEPARLAAQARARKMLAEFLADESPETVKARHCFAFFVGRFGGLLVDPVRTKADADTRCNLHRQQGTFRTLPRGGPVTGCPTCKENSAARGNREASPTAASDALPKFKPPAAWTPEQLAEAEQLRKTAAGGSK